MADTIPLDLHDLASHYATPNVHHWSPEEDEMLRNAVYVHGGRWWCDVLVFVVVRTHD